MLSEWGFRFSTGLYKSVQESYKGARLLKHESSFPHQPVFNRKDGLREGITGKRVKVLRKWMFWFSTGSYRSAPDESIYHYSVTWYV